MVLFVWNNALVVNIAGVCALGGPEAGLPSISGVLNISDNIQSWPWKIKLYFTVNQTERSLKITQIF